MYLERFTPRRFDAAGGCIVSDGLQSTLEKDQDAIHDPHNQRWWTPQFPHRSCNQKSRINIQDYSSLSIHSQGFGNNLQ